MKLTTCLRQAQALKENLAFPDLPYRLLSPLHGRHPAFHRRYHLQASYFHCHPIPSLIYVEGMDIEEPKKQLTTDYFSSSLLLR